MKSSGKVCRSAGPPQGLVNKTFLLILKRCRSLRGPFSVNVQLNFCLSLLMVPWDRCNLLINLVATDLSDFDFDLATSATVEFHTRV